MSLDARVQGHSLPRSLSERRFGGSLLERDNKAIRHKAEEDLLRDTVPPNTPYKTKQARLPILATRQSDAKSTRGMISLSFQIRKTHMQLIFIIETKDITKQT